jgi:small-conductance mechanosensitive channel
MGATMNLTRLTITVVAFLLLAGVALFARRRIASARLSPEQRQRARTMTRYTLGSLFMIFTTVIWAEAILSAALVASGFAVAIVLFHKDLILNVLGWWIKTMSGAYGIGDRLRIGSVRGDVIDYGVLTTTLIEVDPDATHGLCTGNVVIVPNALFLSHPVINETRILAFEWREIEFQVPAGGDWADAEQAMLAAAEQEIASYRPAVEQQLEQMQQAFAFHPLHVDPKTFVSIDSDGRVRIQLRMVLPSRRIRSTSDRLVRAFLAWCEASTNS